MQFPFHSVFCHTSKIRPTYNSLVRQDYCGANNNSFQSFILFDSAEGFFRLPVTVTQPLIFYLKSGFPVPHFLFPLFALILEKNIQNVLLFPTSMGLKNHALSTFMNSHPIFLSFLAGLFPGLFEESGRFAAFKTLLKKRKNPETSISYGIGHGGF